MNAVVTFEQRVKARISEVAAELIPPEALDAMVSAQVAHFQREELPKLIKAEIQAMYVTALKVELAKPEYAAKWNAAGTMVAGDAIIELIESHGGGMLTSMVSMLVQQTLYSMQQGAQRLY